MALTAGRSRDTLDWSRLGQYARTRRLELNLTQEDVAALDGPSTATLYQIENATKTIYGSATLRRLERVLRWTPRSCMRILAGREPVPLNEGIEGILLPVNARSGSRAPRRVQPCITLRALREALGLSLAGLVTAIAESAIQAGRPGFATSISKIRAVEAGEVVPEADLARFWAGVLGLPTAAVLTADQVCEMVDEADRRAVNAA